MAGGRAYDSRARSAPGLQMVGRGGRAADRLVHHATGGRGAGPAPGRAGSDRRLDVQLQAAEPPGAGGLRGPRGQLIVRNGTRPSRSALRRAGRRLTEPPSRALGMVIPAERTADGRSPGCHRRATHPTQGRLPPVRRVPSLQNAAIQPDGSYSAERLTRQETEGDKKLRTEHGA